MRALVKAKAEPGIWQEERPRPEIGPDDVLIRVTHAAICGTDMHIYHWDDWAKKTVPVPLVLGHEYVGVVEAVGERVENVEPGERVSGEGHLVCGRCRNCRAGREHLCRNTVGVGVQRPGAFADFVSIPAHNVYPIPADIPDEVAAILDPLGNAVHTALSFDLVGEDVLITGAGPIGLMAAAVARFVGARQVVVTDVNPGRLALALKMGATRAVRADEESLKDVMADLDMHEGFDVGLEMSGAASALTDMVGAMNHGGKMALLGIPSAPIAIDWNKVIFKGLVIKGVYGREMFETWYKTLAMLQGGLDVAPVITHRLAFEGYQEGFIAMERGEACKVVLKVAA
ncbi:MAG: L-threonine 3-dehydrogenase [Geminicoccaceae bacterium]|nr:L-threonine 3-dehydrogenase [Geminicoccaceae bacterium]